jgi:hypothetical protein
MQTTRHCNADTTPCNPYTDTTAPPPGQSDFCVQFGTSPPTNAPADTLAHVYDSTGRTLGSVTPETYTTLSPRHPRTQASLVHAKESPPLAAALAQAVTHYKKPRGRAKTNAASPLDEATLPQAPERLYAALATVRRAHAGPDPHTQPILEHFASPVNASPLFDGYFTECPADAALGASLDAFSQPFTGFSLAHPPPAQGLETLLWALGSALTHPDTPCLTLAVTHARRWL